MRQQLLKLSPKDQVWFNKIKPEIKEYIEDRITSYLKHQLPNSIGVPNSYDENKEYEAYLYLWIHKYTLELYLGKNEDMDFGVYTKSSKEFNISQQWIKIRLTVGTKRNIGYLEKTMLDFLLKEHSDTFKNVKATGNTASKGVGMSNKINKFSEELNKLPTEMVDKNELTREKVIRLQIKEDVVDTDMLHQLHDVLISLNCDMKEWKDPLIILEDWIFDPDGNHSKDAMGNGNHSHDVAMMEDDCQKCKIKRVPRKLWIELLESGEETTADGDPKKIPLGIKRALFRTNGDHKIKKKGMSNFRFAELILDMSERYGHPIRSTFNIEELEIYNDVLPKRAAKIIDSAEELKETEDFGKEEGEAGNRFRYDSPLGKFILDQTILEKGKVFKEQGISANLWGSSSGAYKLNETWKNVRKNPEAEVIYNMIWHPTKTKKDQWEKDRYKKNRKLKNGKIKKGKFIDVGWRAFNEEHIQKCYVNSAEFGAKEVIFEYMTMFPTQEFLAGWSVKFEEYKKNKKKKK